MDKVFKSPKLLLDNINNKVSNRDIFKYKRESLIKSLTIAINELVIGAFLYNDMLLVNQIIPQYRAILKFIFKNDNVCGDIPSDSEILVKNFIEMIMEFLDNYTPVRNYLEQCILGNREFKYDSINNYYYEDKYDSFSNYARTLDKIKDYPSEGLKNETLNRFIWYIKKYPRTNIYKDSFIKRDIMEKYIEICWLDSEIKFDYDFKDFKYSDIIKFCAALQLIANYHFAKIMENSFTAIACEEMERGIEDLTDLSSETVELFMKLQTYDYDYQKDKLSLIQGLIKCNGKYYFSPVVFTIGLLPVKMYRLIVDFYKEKYEKDRSIIAHKKEGQMTEEIVSSLRKYDLMIETGYKYKENNDVLAEYDMIAFDKETDNMYIIEFKWFFVGDGEREHEWLDKKIEEAIEHRKEKDKYIIENKTHFSKTLFNKEECNEVYELLISQNFGGNKEKQMVTIDFETLKWSIERHDSFKELMDYILNKEYLKSIPVYNEKNKVEIEGYTFDIYHIVAKRQ